MYLIEHLEKWALETPNASAIVFENQSISFAELKARSLNTAYLLRDKFEIEAGDRVAYLGINHPHMLDLVFACARLGAIFTPINSRLARDEYAYLLANAEPGVCFYDEHYAAMVDGLNAGDRTLQTSAILGESVTAQSSIQAQSDPDAPLLLVYTSGTTGRPKGVLLSATAVAANIENSNALYDFQPGQTVLITLPLFHVGGLCILLLPALTHGATISLHARFDPLKTLYSIESENVHTSILVPAQMAAMMALPQWEATNLESLSCIVVGSSIIPKQQIETWHARGVPVSQIYGATETGPCAIGLSIDDAMDHEGSAGMVVKLCRVEIRSRDGVTCANNENGEIWVSGPNILTGYWRSPDETNAVLQNGWYNTGDIGYRDDDGYFWIVDRSKDVIISGGENIYPAEVEAAALQHNEISAIALIGKPDPHWGETPVAAIETVGNASLTLNDLQEFLTDKIARFKQPKEISIFDQLPRNGMGKIEKSVLREIIRQGD